MRRISFRVKRTFCISFPCVSLFLHIIIGSVVYHHYIISSTTRGIIITHYSYCKFHHSLFVVLLFHPLLLCVGFFLFSSYYLYDAGELPVMMPPLKRSVPHPHFSCFSRTSWRRKIALEGLKYLLFFVAFRLSLTFGKSQNGRLH